jgi:transglutaminase-like putative cysteine protease
MGDYAKLAVFVAVLLLSVSMIAVAIDYLGDLSKVELDVEPQNEESSTSNTGGGEAAKGKGKRVKVEGASEGEMFPLFELRYPPMTMYLRQTVGEVYEEGEWSQLENHVHLPYMGEYIPLSVTAHVFPMPCFFKVRPLFNMSGYIPATLNVAKIEFDGVLERYPSLELFLAEEKFSTPYNVSYALYDFPEAMILGVEIRHIDEYLDVPGGMEDRLRALALEIAGDLPTPWEKLKAIENHLKYNYEYDKEHPLAPEGVDPIEWFLFNRTGGTCGHFNSAFVLLARSIGLPARVASGFMVSPESDYQLVYPKDSHIWVEVPFEEFGWVTFDATPERPEDVPMEDPRIPTITEITYHDERAVKGRKFEVRGTVTTINGTEVDGMTVEIFLTPSKNETGIRCGAGLVEHGEYRVACDVAPNMNVGDYQLVAHAMANQLYRESWSDPEITVMAETEVSIQAPKAAYVGEYVSVVGKLIEKSSGLPITNATICLVVGNETGYYITGSDGMVSLTHAYDSEGNKTVSIIMENSRYYIGSNSTFGIAVTIRPPPKQGLFQMLTTFPFNVITAMATVVVVGAAIALTRKPKGPRTAQVAAGARQLPEVEEELPRQFEDYKEGIVKVFNWFYAYVMRRYEGITESMTPREFQQAVFARIPPSGEAALEYLVTAFEIADYSTSRPTQEMLEKSIKAVEVLRGLINHAQ